MHWHLLFLLFLLFGASLEARHERVFTIPKAGTLYLKTIIENITQATVVAPTTPQEYAHLYASEKNSNAILMCHCEPRILYLLPENWSLLLLIRDPRDVALSAVDYIDKCGVGVWPGLPSVLSQQQWSLLSKKEKLSMIVDRYYDDRLFSIANLFEVAIYLRTQNCCFVVKYEELSPEYNAPEKLIPTIQRIAYFFGIHIGEKGALEVVERSFKNGTCWTLNKGNAFRYREESPEILDLLNLKLKKYIDYFGYN